MYVIAGRGPWSARLFDRLASRRQSVGFAHVVSPSDLEALLRLCAEPPTAIFFTHWSWIVSDAVLRSADCVGFHAAELPLGRGGSPVQNLIKSGALRTIVTAFRMRPGDPVDGGPIVARSQPVHLHGAAHQIYDRIADAIEPLILAMIANGIPVGIPQPDPPAGSGFKRLRSDQSDLAPILAGSASASQIYDHIRMLDAPSYPKANTKIGSWALEFDSASLEGEEVVARARFRRG